MGSCPKLCQSNGMLSAGTIVSENSANSTVTIAPANVGVLYYSVPLSSDEADVLIGGNGNDDLRRGAGSDWLSGGWGAGQFSSYYSRRGPDLIAFNTSAVSLKNLAMRDAGDYVLIYMSNGLITLVDTDLPDLSADNFSFGGVT